MSRFSIFGWFLDVEYIIVEEEKNHPKTRNRDIELNITKMSFYKKIYVPIFHIWMVFGC